MSRIVLTTIGSFGDLHPKIAIALELRRRGHDVVFATHREYQRRIEALGFELHRMRPDNTALNDPGECSVRCNRKTAQSFLIFTVLAKPRIIDEDLSITSIRMKTELVGS